MSNETTAPIAIILEIVQPFVKGGTVLEAHTNLTEGGCIDSMNTLQILSELERRFSVRIGALDLTFDDFKTCDKIASGMQRILDQRK